MSENLERVASTADKALNTPIEVTLGGKVRKISFSLYAYCKIEEKSNGAINPFNPNFYRDISPMKMALLAWAGCLASEPNLDYEEFTKSISTEDLANLPTVIEAAIAKSQPVDTKKNETPAEENPAKEE